MMFTTIILSLLLGGILVVYWKQDQKWVQQFQKQNLELAQSQMLLRELIEEQDQRLRKNSTALHSNLKSKIHAIDLAVHRLKKQFPNIQKHQIFDEISIATNSSLELIGELGAAPISLTFYSFGFLPALNELAGELGITIRLNKHQKLVTTSSEILKNPSFYALIKIWIEESVKSFQANEISINLQSTNQHWTLIFKDNGQYISINNNKNLKTQQRLAALSAKIQHQEAGISGRTIILAAKNRLFKNIILYDKTRNH